MKVITLSLDHNNVEIYQKQSLLVNQMSDLFTVLSDQKDL